MLAGFTGVLQVDGYSAYKTLAGRRPVDAPLTLAHCWAHGRRQSYGQVWCTGSGGDLLLGSLNGFAIAEPDAPDELTKAVGAVEPAPVALGRPGELEHHRERGVA